MNIDPQNNASHIYSQHAAKKNPAAAAKPEAGATGAAAQNGDTVKLGALDKLRSQPEIRPEMVAKGKELLNDPNYPSQDIVEKMAKLIVPFADDE